jgi:hypothetical protein
MRKRKYENIQNNTKIKVGGKQTRNINAMKEVRRKGTKQVVKKYTNEEGKVSPYFFFPRIHPKR